MTVTGSLGAFVVFGATVVTCSGVQPLCSGPLASVSPSGQQPCLLPPHPAGVVVVTIGQPSNSGPSAAVLPSSQHPNKLLLHNASGHPLPFLPSAGDTPSGQQPYLVSLQVSGTEQPSSNGPLAAVELSAQHPYFDLRQAAGFLGLGLHLRGVCSLVMIASRVLGVLPHTSVSSVSSVVTSDDDDAVDSSSVDNEDRVDASTVVSVELVASVVSDSVANVLVLLSVTPLDVSVLPVLSISVELSTEDVCSVVASVAPGVAVVPSLVSSDATEDETASVEAEEEIDPVELSVAAMVDCSASVVASAVVS